MRRDEQAFQLCSSQLEQWYFNEGPATIAGISPIVHTSVYALFTAGQA